HAFTAAIVQPLNKVRESTCRVDHRPKKSRVRNLLSWQLRSLEKYFQFVQACSVEPINPDGMHSRVKNNPSRLLCRRMNTVIFHNCNARQLDRIGRLYHRASPLQTQTLALAW